MPLGPLVGLLSMFGWKGILVGLIIAVAIGGGGMCGGERLGCFGGEEPASTSQQQRGGTGKVQSTPQEEELVRFVGYVFDDVQNTWEKQLPGYSGSKMVLFRRGVRSACGTASTAVGPFYCPIDRKVYIDLSFYDELRARFGAPGDFAQAYVIAHELGHHVQNLTDRLGARGNREQIGIELQADCLAGAWAKDAEARGLIEVGDIDEALNAAAAIGDDTLQRKSQGTVQPETWTHGSAEQRSSAFKKGYQGGAPACGV
jgi:predicted metalloprotease